MFLRFDYQICRFIKPAGICAHHAASVIIIIPEYWVKGRSSAAACGAKHHRRLWRRKEMRQPSKSGSFQTELYEG